MATLGIGVGVQKIMLLNPKGGCGKTTIGTSLASYFAASGHATVLLDYDSQGSSTRWLQCRPQEYLEIHGIAAYLTPPGVTRTWQMRFPTGVQKVVVDTAAGLSVKQLPDMVDQADFFVVPVLPSRIDIDAAADFLKALSRMPGVRGGTKRVAVVANRVRGNRRLVRELKSFLAAQEFSFVTSFRESSNYMRATELGIGIHDLSQNRNRVDRQQWEPLLDWLGVSPQRQQQSWTTNEIGDQPQASA